jgi:hypothetical protein
MRIDSAGMPVPDDQPPPPPDLLRRCPGCATPTWPDVSPDGTVRARRCISCQLAVDREAGLDL